MDEDIQQKIRVIEMSNLPEAQKREALESLYQEAFGAPYEPPTPSDVELDEAQRETMRQRRVEAQEIISATTLEALKGIAATMKEIEHSGNLEKTSLAMSMYQGVLAQMLAVRFSV